MKRKLYISVIVNILLAFLIAILLMNKSGIITKQGTKVGGGISYLDNPQWQAYTSMFDLNNRKTDVVFAGDSLTARGRFEEFFPDTNLVNRGIGSDITEGLYNRTDEIIERHPKKIFIMIGINDIGNEIPIEKSMQYYDSILQKLELCNTTEKVYVQSVLPAKTVALEKVQSFNNRLIKVCERYDKVIYLDLFAFFTDNGALNESLYSADGVHLCGEGYKIWIDSIEKYVEDND